MPCSWVFSSSRAGIIRAHSGSLRNAAIVRPISAAERASKPSSGRGACEAGRARLHDVEQDSSRDSQWR